MSVCRKLVSWMIQGCPFSHIWDGKCFDLLCSFDISWIPVSNLETRGFGNNVARYILELGRFYNLYWLSTPMYTLPKQVIHQLCHTSPRGRWSPQTRWLGHYHWWVIDLIRWTMVSPPGILNLSFHQQRVDSFLPNINSLPVKSTECQFSARVSGSGIYIFHC